MKTIVTVVLIVLILYVLIETLKAYKKDKKTHKKIDAEIVDIDKSFQRMTNTFLDRYNTYKYKYTYKFIIDGAEHVVAGNRETSRNKLTVGDKMSIWVNTNNLEEISESDPHKEFISGTVVSVALFAILIVWVVVCML